MSTVQRSDFTRATALWRNDLDGAGAGPDPEASCRLPDGREPGPSPRLVDGIDHRPAVDVPQGRLSPEGLLGDLLRWEGHIRHMYLDKKGLVTVGIGNLLRSPDAARKLPFIDVTTGRPATPDQITAAFEQVAARKVGLSADRYAPATTLRLPAATVRQLAVDRVAQEFLPALRRQFRGFDGYPEGAQKALVDLIYSLGARGLADFKKLHAACEAGDWTRAAGECSRSSARAERNQWTRALFLEAAVVSRR